MECVAEQRRWHGRTSVERRTTSRPEGAQDWVSAQRGDVLDARQCVGQRLKTRKDQGPNLAGSTEEIDGRGDRCVEERASSSLLPSNVQLLSLIHI